MGIKLTSQNGNIDLSNAYLKGPKGDKGEDGRNTVWTGSEAPTEDYYNIWIDDAGAESDSLLTYEDMVKYVDEKLTGDVSLDGYYTKSQTDEAIAAAIPDTSLFVTGEYVQTAINESQQDLSGYATKEYVDNAIDNVDIPDVDLTNYALKSEIPSLDGYAKTADIPDTSSFVTEAEVNELIAEAIGGIENGAY